MSCGRALYTTAALSIVYGFLLVAKVSPGIHLNHKIVSSHLPFSFVANPMDAMKWTLAQRNDIALQKTRASDMDNTRTYDEGCDEDSNDSIDIFEERPKTNLILRVSYDGTQYSGFVGPTLFLNQYLTKINRTDSPQFIKLNPNTISSITNEVLRAACLVHGYLPKVPVGETSYGDPSDDDEEKPEQGTVDDVTVARRFSLISASRTDKGVHALKTACQYLSFDKDLPCGGNLDYFHDGLNRILPRDIRVLAVIPAPSDEFHVRHHNIGKRYSYKVDLSHVPSVFDRLYYWQLEVDRNFRNTMLKKYSSIKKPFSFERVREAADAMLGTHNFEGYRKMSRGNERQRVVNPTCTIHSIEFERIEDGHEKKLIIHIQGNRFLYKMVRCMVSHLVLAGFDVLSVDVIKNVLATGKPLEEIPYAPAHGLFLSQVFFAPDVEAKLNENEERYRQRRNVLFT